MEWLSARLRRSTREDDIHGDARGDELPRGARLSSFAVGPAGTVAAGEELEAEQAKVKADLSGIPAVAGPVEVPWM